MTLPCTSIIDISHSIWAFIHFIQMLFILKQNFSDLGEGCFSSICGSKGICCTPCRRKSYRFQTKKTSRVVRIRETGRVSVNQTCLKRSPTGWLLIETVAMERDKRHSEMQNSRVIQHLCGLSGCLQRLKHPGNRITRQKYTVFCIRTDHEMEGIWK